MENNELISPPEAHYTVYKLTDPVGKVYIGCTGYSVKKRWGGGRHYWSHVPIGKAIAKYGWDNMKKEILCEKLTKEGAEKLEKWFVEYYDSRNPEKGYNRFTGGSRKGGRQSALSNELIRQSVLKKAEDPEYCSMARQRSLDYYSAHPEERERISKQMHAYLHTPEGRNFAKAGARKKPVRCIETGDVYPSQKAAERATGFKGIHKVCSGIQVLSGGYHWEYVNPEDRKKKREQSAVPQVQMKNNSSAW